MEVGLETDMTVEEVEEMMEATKVRVPNHTRLFLELMSKVRIPSL